MGGGEGASHCFTPRVLNTCPLQMLGSENGVYNSLAQEKIYGMLILQIRAFSPPEL